MDNITVKIVADASAVRPGVDETKASLGGIESVIAGIGGWVDNLVSKFVEMGNVGANAGAELASGMRAATAATEAEGNALTAMVMKVHEGAEAVRTFQMRAKEFAELYVAIFAAEGIAHFVEKMGEAAEKTVHLSQTLGLTIAQVQELQGVATGSGVSIDALSKGMLMMDNRAITTAGHTSTAAKAFKAMGISANDGRSNMERLLVLADKFHALPDGPTKAALAMQLMARGAGALIPVLDEGSAGIQALIDKTKEYGGVNEEAVARGEKLARTVNESKMAWEGLKNTLMDALAPTLAAAADGFNHLVQSMVQSYDSGGTVKRVFDAVTDAAHALGRMLEALTPIFQFLGEHIDAVKRVLEALVIVMGVRYAASIIVAIAQSQAVAGAIFAIEARAVGAATTMETLGLVSATAGRAMLAAFGGPVGLAILALTVGVYALITATNAATEADEQYKQKLDEAKTSSDDLTTSLTDLASAHGEARKKAEEEANAHLKNAEAKLKDAQASLVLAEAEASEANQRHSEEENATRPTAGIGAGVAGMGFNPAAAAAAVSADKAMANLKLAKQTASEYQKQIEQIQKAIATPPPSYDTGLDLTNPGKGKKSKDDLVQRLEEGLEAKKAAWEAEQLAQGTAQEYSLESEAAYWAAALQRTDLSAKDKLAIEKKWIAAAQAVQKQDFDQKLDVYKRELAEADKNEQAKLDILKREAVAISQHYRGVGKEVQAANDAVYAQEKRAAEQRLALTQNTLKAIEQMEAAAIGEREKDAQLEEQLGLISKSRLLADERTFEDELYAIELGGLQQRLALVHKEKDPALWDSLNQQIEALETKHQQKLNAIDRQAVLERTAIERAGINTVANSWGSAIGKMLTLQEGWRKGVLEMWQGLQQAIGNAIGTMIQNWLTKQLSALIIGRAQTAASAAAEQAQTAATTAAKLAAITSITTATTASNVAMMTSSIATSKATAAAIIPTQVGIAGASGVASFAAAPWPIDLGAPAFGTSMAASAASLGAVAGFDIGAWDLSKDQMAVVHSGEMIIPANLAGGMRNLFEAVSNDNPPIGGSSAARGGRRRRPPALLAEHSRTRAHRLAATAGIRRQGDDRLPQPPGARRQAQASSGVRS